MTLCHTCHMPSEGCDREGCPLRYWADRDDATYGETVMSDEPRCTGNTHRFTDCECKVARLTEQRDALALLLQKTVEAAQEAGVISDIPYPEIIAALATLEKQS